VSENKDADELDEKWTWTRNTRKTAGSRDEPSDAYATTVGLEWTSEQQKMEKAEEESAEKTRRYGDWSCETGEDSVRRWEKEKTIKHTPGTRYIITRIPTRSLPNLSN